MKLLFTFLLLAGNIVYSQSVSFKEIKMKPNKRLYNTDEYTIIYPIVVTGNKEAEKSINDEIKSSILFESDTLSIQQALKIEIEERLIHLSYSVNYKLNGILSLEISTEGCGAYCSTYSEYFNFNLNNGKQYTIADLLAEDKIEKFRNIVFADKIKALKKYKKEAPRTFETDDDTASYNWAMENVDEYCIDTVQIDKFTLLKDGIEIIDPCEFPHAIRNREPYYRLKYTYHFIAPFLKPEFKKLLPVK